MTEIQENGLSYVKLCISNKVNKKGFKKGL